MTEKVMLSDEELDNVVGGNMQETREFLDTLGSKIYQKGAWTAAQYKAYKAMPLDKQISFATTTMAELGVSIYLQTDNENNLYIHDKKLYSHTAMMNVLNQLK